MLSPSILVEIPMGQQASSHAGDLTVGESSNNSILLRNSPGQNVDQGDNPCVKDKIDNLIENYLLDRQDTQSNSGTEESFDKQLEKSESSVGKSLGEAKEDCVESKHLESEANKSQGNENTQCSTKVQSESKSETIESNINSKEEKSLPETDIKEETSKEMEPLEQSHLPSNKVAMEETSLAKEEEKSNKTDILTMNKSKQNTLEVPNNTMTTFQNLIEKVLDDSLNSGSSTPKQESQKNILELCDLTKDAGPSKDNAEEKTNKKYDSSVSSQISHPRQPVQEDMSISKRKQIALKDHIERVLTKAYASPKNDKDIDNGSTGRGEKNLSETFDSHRKEYQPPPLKSTEVSGPYTCSAQSIVNSVIDRGLGSKSVQISPKLTTLSRDKPKENVINSHQSNKFAREQADSIHNLIMRQIQENFKAEEVKLSKESTQEKSSSTVQGMVQIQNHMIETVSNMSKKMRDTSSMNDHVINRRNSFGSRQHPESYSSEKHSSGMKEHAQRNMYGICTPSSQIHVTAAGLPYGYSGSTSPKSTNINPNQLSPRQVSPRQVSPHHSTKSPGLTKGLQQYGNSQCQNHNHLSLRDCQCTSCDSKIGHHGEHVPHTREYAALKPGGICNGAPYQAFKPQSNSSNSTFVKTCQERASMPNVSTAMTPGQAPSFAYMKQQNNPFKMPQLYPNNPPIPSPKEFSRGLTENVISSQLGSQRSRLDADVKVSPQQPIVYKPVPVPYMPHYGDMVLDKRAPEQVPTLAAEESIPVLDLSVKKSLSCDDSGDAPLDLTVRTPKKSSSPENATTSQDSRHGVPQNLLEHLKNSVDKHCSATEPYPPYNHPMNKQAALPGQGDPKSHHHYSRSEEQRNIQEEQSRGQRPDKMDYSKVIDRMGLQVPGMIESELHPSAFSHRHYPQQNKARSPHFPMQPQATYPSQMSPHIPQPRRAGQGLAQGSGLPLHMNPPVPQHLGNHQFQHPHLQAAALMGQQAMPPQLSLPAHQVSHSASLSPQPPSQSLMVAAQLQAQQQQQQQQRMSLASPQMPSISPKPTGNTQSSSPSFQKHPQENTSPVDLEGGNKRNNVSRHEPIQNIIGNHLPNDILYLICRICGQTYGSPYGFRKHFRNQHGFEPRAEHTIVQTISATKNARQGPVVPVSYSPEVIGMYREAHPNQAPMTDLNTSQGLAASQLLDQSPRSRSNSRSSKNSEDPEIQVRTPDNSLGRDVIKQEGGDILKKEEPMNTEKKCMECPECGQTFQLNDFGLFKRHCRQHGHSKLSAPFLTSENATTFSSDQVSSSRDLSASDFVCHLCGIPVISQAALVDHITNVHPDQVKSEPNSSGKSEDTKERDYVAKVPAESATVPASPDSSCEFLSNKVKEEIADSSMDQEMPILKKQVSVSNSNSNDSLSLKSQDNTHEKVDDTEDSNSEIPEINYMHKKFSSNRKRKTVAISDSDVLNTKFKRLSSDMINRSPASVNSPSAQSSNSIESENSLVVDNTCTEIASDSYPVEEGSENKNLSDRSGRGQKFSTNDSTSDSGGKPVAQHNLPFVWDRVTRSQAGKNIKPPTYH